MDQATVAQNKPGTNYLGHLIRLTKLVVMGCGVFLIFGFLRFGYEIENYSNGDVSQADAIIVLTGGRNRVETGLELLKNHKGNRMLISGVHQNTTISALTHQFPSYMESMKCCIDMDKTAKNTLQNALGSVRWVRNHNFSKILLVTSDYHMPRALIEFSRELPDVNLLPYVVADRRRKLLDLLTDHQRLRITIIEYIKTMVTSAQIARSSQDKNSFIASIVRLE